jgi:hypothetical protein
MAATLQTPNAVARSLSSKTRTVTPKAVRTMARATIARFDKTRHPEYQSHAYTAVEVAALRKAFAARGQRSAAQPVRKPVTRKPSGSTVTKATKAEAKAAIDA